MVYCAVRYSDHLAPATHGTIITTAAIIFILGDAFFTRLITELNTVLRATGYSLWQAERLHALVPPFRNRLWALWSVSQLLRAVAAVAGAFLQRSIFPNHTPLLVGI